MDAEHISILMYDEDSITDDDLIGSVRMNIYNISNIASPALRLSGNAVHDILYFNPVEIQELLTQICIIICAAVLVSV